MSERPSTADTIAIGAEAYIFGYPMVLMDMTRAVMTAVPKPNGVQAPINCLLHLRSFPEYTMVEVSYPNADTLYSTAWLDLTREPMVLTVPRIDDRYYLFQAIDAWTIVFASIGTRTTGTGAS